MSPQSAAPSSRFVATRIAVVLVFAAAFLAYAPALFAGFVWNDNDYVTAPALRSLHGLWRIWFEVGATEQYYPLLHSAFWLEHRLWGDAAAGYHAINITLHAMTACLFGLLLNRLAMPGAWFAALLFALHPVHAESVAWISEQKNTLSAVFYLGAALGYLRFSDSRRPRDYVVSLLLFACAILAKSVAATLPAALLVVLWWKQDSFDWRRDIAPLLPWLLLGAAAGIFSSWVERTIIGADGAHFSLSFAQRFILSGRIAWFYFGKLLWPAGLMFIYPRWQIDSAMWTAWLFPSATIILLILLWRRRHQQRGPLAAVLLFGGTLFPVLGFFNVYAFLFSFAADHFQYLPSLGLIALAGAAITRALGHARGEVRFVAASLCGIMLAAFGVTTWRQSATYRDVATFYETILERNPACWMAHNNLANEFAKNGQAPAAIAHYQQALRLRPDYPEAENNLAVLLTQTGQLSEALQHFETASRLKPASASTHFNWGKALGQAGKFDEAAKHFDAALRLDPAYPSVQLNLGITMSKLGRNQDAVAHFQTAAAQEPNRAEIFYNWGVAVQSLGQWVDAQSRYAEAARLNPTYVEARNNLGVALRKTGRPQEAVAQFEQALKTKPDFVEAHYNLALALKDLNQLPLAITHLSEAVRLSPNLAEPHYQLALALRAAGRVDEAKAQHAEAKRLKPDLPSIDF